MQGYLRQDNENYTVSKSSNLFDAIFLENLCLCVTSILKFQKSEHGKFDSFENRNFWEHNFHVMLIVALIHLSQLNLFEKKSTSMNSG